MQWKKFYQFFQSTKTLVGCVNIDFLITHFSSVRSAIQQSKFKFLFGCGQTEFSVDWTNFWLMQQRRSSDETNLLIGRNERNSDNSYSQLSFCYPCLNKALIPEADSTELGFSVQREQDEFLAPNILFRLSRTNATSDMTANSSGDLRSFLARKSPFPKVCANAGDNYEPHSRSWVSFSIARRAKPNVTLKPSRANRYKNQVAFPDTRARARARSLARLPRDSCRNDRNFRGKQTVVHVLFVRCSASSTGNVYAWLGLHVADRRVHVDVLIRASRHIRFCDLETPNAVCITICITCMILRVGAKRHILGNERDRGAARKKRARRALHRLHPRLCGGKRDALKLVMQRKRRDV